jgi:magnesium transporter
MAEDTEARGVRDQDGNVRPEFVDAVKQAVEAGDPKAARILTRKLHEADLADLIALLPSEDRVKLIQLLGRNFDVEALAELDEGVRDDLMEVLPNEAITAAIRRLDTDDALYLIENLDETDRQEILSKLPRAEREALRRALDYPENTAGRLMKTEFVAVPEFWSVGQTIDFMRTERDLPDEFVEIYVVDPAFHLIGALPLSRILRSRRETLVSSIMETDQTVFKVTDEDEEVAYKFEQYHLVSAPVVDEDNRLVGMLMVEDIVEVIQEEAQEDILRLGGVGREEITANVLSTARSRFSWLLVNLATAILASWVISWFDATIEQMVALAVLMPIVASMGGNAGTQTMTVAVRALATRDLGRVNAPRVVWRECAVGVINGFLFAIIMGAFAWWWFGSGGLGLVIGAAMVINLLAAALAGILVPLALDLLGVDPAVASAVFVTTVTDVMGFFAFLGLAALWLV